jgi:hypothetical protein
LPNTGLPITDMGIMGMDLTVTLAGIITFAAAILRS